MSLTLYFSKTSPYARKIRIALIELGLQGEVTEIPTDPFTAGPEYLAVNPLSKVPALITREGLALPDSRLILEYLHSLNDALVRAEGGADRWVLRRLQQYADGVTDAATAANGERRRQPAQFSQAGFDRQRAAVLRTLDVLDANAALLRREGPITTVEITAVAALGYIDLRFPDWQWRDGRNGLADWQRAIAARPSVRATDPAV